jgi:hypothetical protein
MENSASNRRTKKRKQQRSRAKARTSSSIPLLFQPKLKKGSQIIDLIYSGVQSSGLTASAGGVVNTVWTSDLATSFTFQDIASIANLYDEYRILESELMFEKNYVCISNTPAATSNPVLYAIVDYSNSTAASSYIQCIIHDNKHVIRFTEGKPVRIPIRYDAMPDIQWYPLTNLNSVLAYVKFYGTNFAANQLVAQTCTLTHKIQFRGLS